MAGGLICTRHIPKALAADPSPRLCRLYFINTNNFLLDVGWFSMLHHDNWRAGFDARDVEFAMGGDRTTRMTHATPANMIQYTLPLKKGIGRSTRGPMTV